MRPPVAALIGMLALSACNRYEMFRLAGYQQESFSNDADVLFVIDNSSSMTDEATELARNMGVFVDALANPAVSGVTTNGLPDAAGNYIEYVQNRGQFLDYQLGITTTDVEHTYGELYGVVPFVTDEDTDVAGTFSKGVLCEATCFNESDVPSDATYQCGDPLGEDPVSYEYLGCLCGDGQWDGLCGSGSEEHLEAVFMALCRSTETPPDECFEQNQFSDADVLSNAGFVRPDSAVIIVMVTDEGDSSRRMTTGDAVPDEYEALFNKFPNRLAFAVIGPRTDDCNSGGADPWGVDRLRYFVDKTNGIWFDIAVRDEATDECVVTDFAAALEELGQLLNSLNTAFPLTSVPDVATIRAFVDGEEVPRSVETVGEDLSVTYTDGWSYLPSENAVEFHGNAVPDYNADVEIYYLPLDGMPRELPF
jgi:hypothetical protein